MLLHKSESQNFQSPSNPSDEFVAQQVLETIFVGDSVLTVTQKFNSGWQVTFGTLEEPEEQSSSKSKSVDEQL